MQRHKPYNKRKAWATKRNNATSKFRFGGEVKFGGKSAFTTMSMPNLFKGIIPFFRNLVKGNR